MKNVEISIPIKDEFIKGNLTLVDNSNALVVFAHGSGSSRFSKRNQYVADLFNQAGLSTFLFDLLTQQEDEIDQITRQFRFDIPRLAQRLVMVAQWLKGMEDTKHLSVGYFGASTGAAAALIAAAKIPENVSAVVSRGGRPDLAIDYLDKVQAPTLLIVGQLDYEVITLNEFAFKHLHCTKELYTVPGATHLFEESGTLDQAAKVAVNWFTEFLIKK